MADPVSQTTADHLWPERQTTPKGEKPNRGDYEQQWTPELVAQSHGRDARAHGVGIQGARAYSDRLDIQRAWEAGWVAADDERRGRSASYGR